TDAFGKAAAWMADPDWRLRAAAAEALGEIRTDSATVLLEALVDSPDGRVAAAAFSALSTVDTSRASARARRLLQHVDPVVRAAAATVVATSPVAADLPLLLDAYERAIRDPIPDARLATIAA